MESSAQTEEVKHLAEKSLVQCVTEEAKTVLQTIIKRCDQIINAVKYRLVLNGALNRGGQNHEKDFFC